MEGKSEALVALMGFANAGVEVVDYFHDDTLLPPPAVPPEELIDVGNRDQPRNYLPILQFFHPIDQGLAADYFWLDLRPVV